MEITMDHERRRCFTKKNLQLLFLEIDQFCRLPQPCLEPLETDVPKGDLSNTPDTVCYPKTKQKLTEFFQEIQTFCGRDQLPSGSRLTDLDEPSLLLPGPPPPIQRFEDVPKNIGSTEIRNMMQEMQTLLTGAKPPFRLGDLENDDEIFEDNNKRQPPMFSDNNKPYPSLSLELLKQQFQQKHSFNNTGQNKTSCLLRINRKKSVPSPLPLKIENNNNNNNNKKKKIQNEKLTKSRKTSIRIKKEAIIKTKKVPPTTKKTTAKKATTKKTTTKKTTDKRKTAQRPESNINKIQYKMVDFMESGYSSSHSSSVPSPASSQSSWDGGGGTTSSISSVSSSIASPSSLTSSSSSLISTDRNSDGKLVYFCDQYERFMEKKNRRSGGGRGTKKLESATLTAALDKVLHWNSRTINRNCPTPDRIEHQRSDTPPPSEEMLNLDDLENLEPKPDLIDFDELLSFPNVNGTKISNYNDADKGVDSSEFDQWLTEMLG